MRDKCQFLNICTDKKLQRTLFILIIFPISILLSSCSTNVENDDGRDIPNIPVEPIPHQQLSDYGLFKGELNALNPAEGVLPYTLNTQLFTDYAEKQRFIYVPADVSIDVSSENVLDYPTGTVLVKNFYYSSDQRSPDSDRTLIETRLLIRYSDSWIPSTYAWNSEQTDAILAQNGGDMPVSWTDHTGEIRNINYVIPAVSECGDCHSKNGKLSELGPDIKNLNRVHDYVDGPVNQLEQWRASGLMSSDLNPAELPLLPSWKDDSWAIEQRAKAYLEVNCSHCHNDVGSAQNFDLSLSYEEESTEKLGVCQEPLSGRSRSTGITHIIVPGQPDESLLFHRMSVTDPFIMMPRIGRTIVHEEALELMREWITSMDLPACE